MSKADQLRNFFIENPGASQKEALETLEKDNFDKNYIKVQSWKDAKTGRGEKKEIGDGLWTMDYSKHIEGAEEKRILAEWKREIQIRLIEQLVEANEKETNSEIIRLNAKTIYQLLREI